MKNKLGDDKDKIFPAGGYPDSYVDEELTGLPIVGVVVVLGAILAIFVVSVWLF